MEGRPKRLWISQVNLERKKVASRASGRSLNWERPNKSFFLLRIFKLKPCLPNVREELPPMDNVTSSNDFSLLKFFLILLK